MIRPIPTVQSLNQRAASLRQQANAAQDNEVKGALYGMARAYARRCVQLTRQQRGLTTAQQSRHA